MVDSYTDNRRLALVFEAKFGSGRLLVCSVDVVGDLEKRPVARQLKRSLLDYIECWRNGRWYEPPVNLDSLAKAFRAGTHHSSAIFFKRNVLLSLD